MAKKKKETLTFKQQRFVEAFCGEANYNATKAAIIAKYSEHSAGVIGQENLKKPLIKRAIDERLKQLSEESRVYYHEVAQSVRRIIRFDHRNIFDPGWKIKPIESLKTDTALALNRVKVTETVLQKGNKADETLIKRTVEISIPDRIKACELAAKMGGFLTPSGEGEISEAFMEFVRGLKAIEE